MARIGTRGTIITKLVREISQEFLSGGNIPIVLNYFVEPHTEHKFLMIREYSSNIFMAQFQKYLPINFSLYIETKEVMSPMSSIS